MRYLLFSLVFTNQKSKNLTFHGGQPNDWRPARRPARWMRDTPCSVGRGTEGISVKWFVVFVDLFIYDRHPIFEHPCEWYTCMSMYIIYIIHTHIYIYTWKCAPSWRGGKI